MCPLHISQMFGFSRFNGKLDSFINRSTKYKLYCSCVFIYFFGTHLFMYTWRSAEIFECLIITIPWGPMLEYFFHIQILFNTTPISVVKQVFLTSANLETKNNIHFGWRDEKNTRHHDKKWFCRYCTRIIIFFLFYWFF